MSVALASASHLSFSPSSSTALSPTAESLSRALSEAFSSRSSVMVRGPQDVRRDLLKAMTAAADDGVFVTPDAYERASCVLSALPAKFPKPEIVVESDGEIAFDWDAGARRLLSVSVGDSAMLGYAALVGPEPTHGKVAFAGAFPVALTFLLRRIYPAWAADRR